MSAAMFAKVKELEARVAELERLVAELKSKEKRETLSLKK
jgi:hypothetical protein